MDVLWFALGALVASAIVRQQPHARRVLSLSVIVWAATLALQSRHVGREGREG